MDSTQLAIIVTVILVVAFVGYWAGARAGKAANAGGDPTSKKPAADDDTGPTSAAGKPSTPPAATRSDVPPDLPQFSVEDDDDVEPTKLGAFSAGSKPIQPKIQRIVFDEDADSIPPVSTKSVFLVHATAQTDTGLRRKRNEDSLLVMESHELFVVADGMGGYKGGAVASELAVRTIAEAFSSNRFPGAPHEGISKEGSELARAIQTSNQAILDLSTTRTELKGMGTTVCAARFSPNKERMWIGHVGDSRCYRMRAGVLKQMTSDHTMADFGVTGPEAAHLSRAIGIWSTVPIDVVVGRPKTGDVYLLCSDGLTKMLSDEAIATVLRHEEDPKAAVERLIFFSNARGGKDNITVILIRVVPPNWQPRPSTLDPAELEALPEATRRETKSDKPDPL